MIPRSWVADTRKPLSWRVHEAVLGQSALSIEITQNDLQPPQVLSEQRMESITHDRRRLTLIPDRIEWEKILRLPMFRELYQYRVAHLYGFGLVRK